MVDLITPNFSVAEMACKCGCGKHGMDEEFMRMLQELRNEVGLLRISSGFRCDAHNDKVSKIKNGPHTQAKASDIRISVERAMMLFEKARQIDFSGIVVSQKGAQHKRFVHVDTLERKALWSY